MQIITTQSTSFATISADYLHFEDQLRQARFGPLAGQEGLTAHDLRDTFQRGEEHAREVVEKNENKKSAYDSAYESTKELRSILTEIAQTGNCKIGEIKNSKEPIPIKIEKITEIVCECQARASSEAAKFGDTILAATQKILDREGISISARQFAKSRGANVEKISSLSGKNLILDQVKKILNDPNPLGYQAHKNGSPETPELLENSPLQHNLPEPETPTENQAPRELLGQLGPTSASVSATTVTSQTNAQTPSAALGQLGPTSASVSATTVTSQINAQTPSAALGRLGATPASPLPQVPMPAATAPQIAAPSVSGPPSLPNMPNLPNLPAAATAPSITPGQLLQSFDHGMQTGTPMSAAANALAGGPMATIESHLPPPAPETPAAPAASNIPASTHAAAYEASAHSPAALTEASPPQNHTATADSSTANTTYLTAPAGALPPTPAGTSPTSSLPAYGTDIRPPATTTSTTALPTGLHPSAPASAPISPSSAGSNMSQPAVVRQPVHPTASAQGAPTPPGVVARAVASTAAGAAAGAASATTAARKRLQRLVDAVSRQEPHLRWAAGDRRDGTTVLVTDLASGWIPPHIDVPVGMELCVPAYRRGSIQALLGEVTVTADYTSLHGVPPITALDPVPTSPRARQLPVIEELGWQLGQATQRRDGLPRLACTLAIAAARSTGVLDSEVELLRMEVDKLRTRVLQSYPDNVEPAAVTDWQLLAAIDALVHGDKIGANYHFSWFQAWGQASVNRQVS
ncbi:MAG: DUF5631 domain-containing protein [Mycobacteriaceae bacterium]|nr:DUF5631 domain-containing protein [Mycobacteriaceae bacterium]